MSIKANEFAVITGASRGLGKAYAYELAKKGCNVILVSLPGEGLEALANEISDTYKVRVEYVETDLTSVESITKLSSWINLHFKVFLLINNAGTGGSHSFIDAAPDYINRIIQLNITATSILTRQLLPNLLKRPKAYILNVSSMAAFVPTGYKTVYPASKSFIYFFSYGLRAELKDTNVSVSVVHPGPMSTNEEIAKRIEKQGRLAKILLDEPSDLATMSIEGLINKKAVIISKPLVKWLMSMIPRQFLVPTLTRNIKREIYI